MFDLNKEPPYVDYFDRIEVNHYHNEWGAEVWSQLICWDWNPRKGVWRVEHYIMMKDAYKQTEEGKNYIISRLMSDDKEFFDFCALNGLKYGNTITITKQFAKNKMTQLTINNNTLLLNEDFTNIIYVNEQ